MILIDLIRYEKAEKRGGQIKRENLGEHAATALEGHNQMIVDLQVVLEKMEQFDPSGADLVRYRHFLGCTFEEAAALLELSKTETIRTHQRALLWLRREPKGYDLET